MPALSSSVAGICDTPVIYSNDIATGLAADVGLPSSFQSNFVTIAENSAGLAVFTSLVLVLTSAPA